MLHYTTQWLNNSTRFILCATSIGDATDAELIVLIVLRLSEWSDHFLINAATTISRLITHNDF